MTKLCDDVYAIVCLHGSRGSLTRVGVMGDGFIHCQIPHGIMLC